MLATFNEIFPITKLVGKAVAVAAFPKVSAEPLAMETVPLALPTI